MTQALTIVGALLIVVGGREMSFWDFAVVFSGSIVWATGAYLGGRKGAPE